MDRMLNPTITITNLEGEFWLVGFRHDFDDKQFMEIKVKIPKLLESSVLDVTRAALQRLQEMIPPLYRQTGPGSAR